MSGVWGWGGWIAIMLLPLSFWALIVAFMVIVFGRGSAATQLEVEEMEVPVAEPVRDTGPAPGGLGWRAPVPSHH